MAAEGAPALSAIRPKLACSGPIVRSGLQSLPIYQPPSGRGGLLRLDANEGPPPPAGLLQELLRETAAGLVYYPEYGRLIQAAATHYGVSPAGVLPVAGADEGIRLVMQAFCGPGDRVVTVRPTFSMYALYARMAGAGMIEIPLGTGHRPDLPALLAAVAEATLTVLASPNNPTALALTQAELLSLLEAGAGRPFLLDETYAEFCGQNFVPLIETCPNLIVLRTLSKARGLPGLRCGFVLGAPDVVAQLDTIRSPYNLSAAAVTIGAGVLERDAGYPGRLARAVGARREVQARLGQAGIHSCASVTHFFLLPLGAQAPAAEAYLRSRGILVRLWGEGNAACLRISLCTSEEGKQLLRELLPWTERRPLGAETAPRRDR